MLDSVVGFVLSLTGGLNTRAGIAVYIPLICISLYYVGIMVPRRSVRLSVSEIYEGLFGIYFIAVALALTLLAGWASQYPCGSEAASCDATVQRISIATMVVLGSITALICARKLILKCGDQIVPVRELYSTTITFLFLGAVYNNLYF